MPRKGRVSRDNADATEVSAGMAAYKKAAKSRDRQVQPPAPAGGDVRRYGRQPGASDPMAAVLADGSDIPSQRVLQPTREEVERRAYEVYLRRAGAPGHPDDDWYQAERELAEEYRMSLERSAAETRHAPARARKAKAASVTTADTLRADQAEG